MTPKNSTVVVVNDVDNFVVSLVDNIEEIDCRFVSWQGVKPTLDLVGGVSPDLIVINITPETRWGAPFCRELKNDKRTSCVPVVFVCDGRYDRFLKRLAFVYGCIDFLDYRLSEADLTEKIRQYAAFGKIEKGLRNVLDRLSKENVNAVH